MAKLPINENPQFNQSIEEITKASVANPDTFNPRYQTLLDNDNYLKQETDKMNREVVVTVLADGWSETEPYIQEVTVLGMKDIDKSDCTLFIPEGVTKNAEKVIRKSAGYVSYIDSLDGGIRITCVSGKPTVDFQIVVKGA